ncbi:hypothetical protein [Halocalculus aciditolerans]|uniref:Uncharacterized protein n=1 Tax=Halocalculus aciditolerans TaxID=1383812 RepID=A0A830FK18_9EURY|nr:hypothetical protein [Halocalculus aciditolerans]GGL64214.1 hypothetical protein GCM10009039_22570 [Halocalculus aciditolerans]
MPDGTPVSHTDYERPSQARGRGEYSTLITYDEHRQKTGFGSVASRFDSGIELTHPAPDIEALRQTTHLTGQLHQYNRDRSDREWPYANDGTTLYDLTVLDVMEKALAVEDLSPDSLDVPTRRFKVVFLKNARQPATHKGFYEYILDSDPVLTELGYSGASDLPGYETLRVASEDKLPSELSDVEQNAFDAAVIRAVYAVYRNGIAVPATVGDAYGFEAVTPPLSERSVRRTDKKTALRNWVRLLFEETTHPLTFHRSRPRTDFQQYIGVFAASALYGCGVQAVADVADYNYPRDNIPKGSGIGKYIRSDALPLNDPQAALANTENQTITAQFDAVHRATLQLADKRGFFAEPRSLAVDLYRIEWTGVENDVTINRPPKSENDTRSEWTYAVLGIIDTEARFTLGTRWLPDKSKYPSAVTELTPVVVDFVDVEALYADSEMVSGALIDAFRKIAGSNWAVRAPNHTVIKQLKSFTPENHTGYVPAVAWKTSPKPAAVSYSYDSSNPSLIEFTARDLKQADPGDIEDQTNIFDFTGTEASAEDLPATLTEQFDDPASLSGVGDTSTHAAYLTDRSLPERSGGGIHFPYYQRWAIEETMNQISNDFMPMINSSNEKLRLYGVNISILLQNWHTLINRAPSPELALRLDVTHQELLRAIEDVAFSDPA